MNALRRLPLERRALRVRKAPVAAAAVALLHGIVFAQSPAAPNTTSADVLEATTPFETGGQEGIGPRPFTSFLQRLGSPVEKIALKAAADNLTADGQSGTDVRVQLFDREGRPVRGEVEVTIEVDGGARVLLPGRSTTEAGPDRGDMNRVTPGTQVTVRDGVLTFKLVAPFKPEAVNVRVSVRGVAEKIVVRYVPELREMIAVGLLEGQIRSDRFDASQIVPVRENDSFDNELRNFNKEFNGGKSRAGARAALYLKGKVSGAYLLTLAYDSEKVTHKRLFNDIDPNLFYPVYGDSSIRGVDAQSSGKLYVRLDKGLSYLMYGDFTTADPNPARVLGQYSRSLPGLRGHYEEGRVVANVFAARQSLSQVVDEFPARGVSGPYSVSRSNGIYGSEKIEIVVRDRNRPAVLLKVTPLVRFQDYEFEPFNGQIVFRSPVPSFDDQLNPVSIRVTYEVDQGGRKYGIYGGDVALKITDNLVVGASAAKDENPSAPFSVVGANVALKLSKNTEVVAEFARAQSTLGATSGNFTVNNSSAYIGGTGEVTGNAARVEIRHSDETLRARAYAQRTDKDFNNPSSGAPPGRTEGGVSGGYKINDRLSVNGEVLYSEDRILGGTSKAATVGADYKVTDRITIGAGARRLEQSSMALVPSVGSNCVSSTGIGLNGNGTGSGGYNVGYGINQTGNQQIDPVTGLPVVCTTIAPPTTATSVDTTSLFLRGTWKITDTISANGEIQRELGSTDSTLWRIGADWQVADRTRIYTRYERSHQYVGAYGLGTGSTGNNFAVGIDTQYMQDGSVYSEYRLRDASAGREVQAAVGLRNGWKLAEGWRLTTNVEHLYSSAGNANAAGLGLEYTASELWKGSGRLEWRDDAANTNYLATIGLARKLDRDWSLLARDYLNIVRPDAGGNKLQNHFQIGFAYRPVDHNKFDALGLYEQKRERDPAADVRSTTDMASIRANYHPSRPWLVSGRFAAKRVNELLLGSVRDSYSAVLLGGRVTYDITNQWSLGAISTVLVGKGGAKQYAYGLEVGYVLMDNMLVTLGYNWRGFSDDDLAGSNYTNRGWVLGVRYKFDEDIFKKADATVNKTLTPPAAAAKP